MFNLVMFRKQRKGKSHRSEKQKYFSANRLLLRHFRESLMQSHHGMIRLPVYAFFSESMDSSDELALKHISLSDIVQKEFDFTSDYKTKPHTDVSRSPSFPVQRVFSGIISNYIYFLYCVRFVFAFVLSPDIIK